MAAKELYEYLDNAISHNTKKNLEAAKALLERTPDLDVNFTDEIRRKTSLSRVCSTFGAEASEIIKMLLNRPNINVNMIDKCGKSSLQHACEAGNLDAVILLIEDNRVNTNDSDVNERTPLWSACFCNHIRVVDYMLENTCTDLRIKGTYEKLCGFDEHTPLEIAERRVGREEITFMIKEAMKRRVYCDFATATKWLATGKIKKEDIVEGPVIFLYHYDTSSEVELILDIFVKVGCPKSISADFMQELIANVPFARIENVDWEGDFSDSLVKNKNLFKKQNPPIKALPWNDDEFVRQ